MRAAFLLIVASATTAVAAPTRTSQRDPYPGIHHERWEDGTNARIELVRIDLSSQEVALFATKEGDRGMTTGEYAESIAAQVAINGDAFAVAGYVPRGFAMGDTVAWTTTRDDDRSAALHMRRVADSGTERNVAAIAPPEVAVSKALLPPGTQGVVSGRPLLVRTGNPETSFDCDDPATLACMRAPRSAVAVSENGATMWLVTVDGWQGHSAGMTAAELATFLVTQGAYMAFALDGGSSSTLVIDNAVVNSPSDGVQRTGANHIGVKFGALPKGQLVGVICRDDVFACREDSSLRLPGTEVTLDDGRVDIVGADAFYSFPSITPRLACVTARKTGFRSNHKCHPVEPGKEEYNSIALVEGEDPPGGIGPCVCPADPDSVGPGGTGDGAVDVEPPTGCCGAGGAPGGSLILAAISHLLVRRRRVIQTR